MKWETLTKEQKQYVFLGGVVAIALIYVLYTVLSGLLTSGEGDAAAVDLETLESEVEAAERTLRKERPIMQEYEEVLAYLNEVRGFFPNEDNRYSWVTELIYTQGRNYGIEVESISEMARQETPGADAQAPEQVDQHGSSFQVQPISVCGEAQNARSFPLPKRGPCLIRSEDPTQPNYLPAATARIRRAGGDR